MFPEHMLSVRATVESGREAEFNHWYDCGHVPDAVRMLPGCLGAARYKVVLEDGSAEIKELIKIYDRDIGAFSTRTRTTYERVLVHPKT